MQAPAAPESFMPPFVPWVVLALGLALSVGLWRDANRTYQEKQRLAFELQVEKIVNSVENRLAAHEQILRGTAGLFSASGEVTRDEFRNYIETLHLDRRYPGIQGVGLTRLVTPAQLQRHVEAVRHEGYAEYRVYPEGRREIYSTIVYLEPFNWRNQRAFGYDMYSEPIRRAAMDQARDTGRPVMSGKVVLVQETNRDIQAGTVLYMPIFGHADLGSIAERRRSIVGWVFMPLRMQDMLDGVFESEFGELENLIGLRVYDGDEAQPGNLLYRSAGEKDARPDGLATSKRLVAAGRLWRIEARALPHFATLVGDNRAMLLLLGAGSITFLLTLFLEMFNRYGRRLSETNRALTHSRNELQNIYDTSSAAIFLIDHRGVIIHGNRRLAEMFDATLEEVIGSRYEDWVDPAERNLAQRNLAALLQGGGGKVNVERTFRRKGNVAFVGDVVGRTMRGADEEIIGLVGVITDITQQRQTEAELRIAAIAFESSEAMVVTDANARVVRINRAFTELTGYTQEEVIGRNMSMLNSGRHSQDFFEAMWHELLTKGAWQGEIWNRHKEGKIYPQWQTITAVKAADGKTTHYVGSAFDITQRVALDNEMRNLAFYDHLTGLANRRLFGDRLQHAFAKCTRSKKLGALIYLDLDHFKELNDHLGHAEGDRLLETVADRLIESVREGDTVARLGGDEFVVLLEDLDDDPIVASGIATEIAEELRRALNRPYSLHGEMPAGWQCTPSIGVALFCENPESCGSVVNRADQALYSAKRSGRNVVRLDKTPI